MSRRHIAISVVLTACGQARAPSTESPRALPMAPAEQAACPAEPPPSPPLAPQSAAAWAWARAIAPEIDHLIPDVAITPANAPWRKHGEKLTLYAPKDWLADGVAKTCVPIRMTAEEGALHAVVSASGADAPKFGCRSDLLLGVTAELVEAGCPSASGQPYGIVGDGRVIGHGLVVDEDGTLAYDNVVVSISPLCRWITVQRSGCAETTCRSCQIVLQPSARGGAAVGFGAPQDPAPVVVQRECEPCPIDHHAAAIPQLAEILRGRTFQHRFGGGLYFSPTKAICEARAKAM